MQNAPQAISIPWYEVHSSRLCLWWKKLEREKFCTRIYAIIDTINQRSIAIRRELLWLCAIQLGVIAAPRITNATIGFNKWHHGQKFSVCSSTNQTTGSYTELSNRKENWVAQWNNGLGIGPVIKRSRVQLLVKFTAAWQLWANWSHSCVHHQAVSFGIGQRVATLCGWESNLRSRWHCNGSLTTTSR